MQVHQDIDLTVQDALRRLRIAQVRDGLEMLKCRLQALTVRTAVLDAVAEGKYLDATAVMLLEQVGQQQSDRMGAQISRQIADPQARMMVAATRRQRSRRGRQLSSNIGASGQQLERRVIVRRQHRQCRMRHQQRVRADLAKRQSHRPDALALTQVLPVLKDIGLLGIDLQTAAQSRLSLSVAQRHFPKTTQLVQCPQQQVLLCGQPCDR